MLVGTARGSEGHSGALCGIWGKKDGKKKKKLFAQQKMAAGQGICNGGQTFSF